MSKFTITKGQDNTFTFTVKQTGNTLPMEITGTDTFKGYLRLLSAGSDATSDVLIPFGASSSPNIHIEVEDALSGRITLRIKTAATAGLVSSVVGTAVDRYYTAPMYKLVLACTTVNNGDFITKVEEVYVD